MRAPSYNLTLADFKYGRSYVPDYVNVMNDALYRGAWDEVCADSFHTLDY